MSHCLLEDESEGLLLLKVNSKKQLVRRYQHYEKVATWSCHEWEATGHSFVTSSFAPKSRAAPVHVDIWNVLAGSVFSTLTPENKLPRRVIRAVEAWQAKQARLKAAESEREAAAAASAPESEVLVGETEQGQRSMDAGISQNNSKAKRKDESQPTTTRSMRSKRHKAK